jgi:Rieske Fe-S protein
MTCPNRRDFLKASAATGSALTLGGLVAAASSPSRAFAAPPLEVADGKVTLNLADYTELSADYTATKLKIKGVGKLLLTRLEGENYLAISSKCTHQGCQVKWSQADKKFQCPCHDSAFDLEGKPSGGPAEKPLPIFATALKDGTITITIPPDFKEAEGGKEGE